MSDSTSSDDNVRFLAGMAVSYALAVRALSAILEETGIMPRGTLGVLMRNAARNCDDEPTRQAMEMFVALLETGEMRPAAPGWARGGNGANGAGGAGLH